MDIGLLDLNKLQLCPHHLMVFQGFYWGARSETKHAARSVFSLSFDSRSALAAQFIVCDVTSHIPIACTTQLTLPSYSYDQQQRKKGAFHWNQLWNNRGQARGSHLRLELQIQA